MANDGKPGHEGAWGEQEVADAPGGGPVSREGTGEQSYLPPGTAPGERGGAARRSPGEPGPRVAPPAKEHPRSGPTPGRRGEDER